MPDGAHEHQAVIGAAERAGDSSGVEPCREEPAESGEEADCEQPSQRTRTHPTPLAPEL